MNEPMRRVVVGLVAVAAAALLLWMLLSGSGPVEGASESTPPAESTTTPTSAPLPPEVSAVEVAAIEEGLVSQQADEVAAVLASEVAAAYLDDPSPLLPSGTELVIRPESWKVDGEVAAARATVDGQLWELGLVLEEGAWKVYAATEGSGA